MNTFYIQIVVGNILTENEKKAIIDSFPLPTKYVDAYSTSKRIISIFGHLSETNFTILDEWCNSVAINNNGEYTISFSSAEKICIMTRDKKIA